MSTCGTCKHWKPPLERTGFRQVYTHEADITYGECGLITLAFEYEDAPDPLPLAVTKDGSDFAADLLTQPKFGCVLWEAKT